MSRVPVILTTARPGAVFRGQERALYCAINGPWLWRDGQSVRAEPELRRFFLMLAANAPGLIGRREAAELMWGDRRDGGPDDADRALGRLMCGARLVGAALGFAVRSEHGRGFGARAVAAAEGEPAGAQA